MIKLFILVIVLLAGCEYCKKAETGTDGGACYGNSTCNDGLKCVDEVCASNGGAKVSASKKAKGECDPDTSNPFPKMAIVLLIVLAFTFPLVMFNPH